MPLRPFLLFLLSFSLCAFAADQPKAAPLPYDPLELATGPTVVPDTPEKRALVLNLLERARQNNAMHAPGGAPFTIKVSFNSIYAGGNSHNNNDVACILLSRMDNDASATPGRRWVETEYCVDPKTGLLRTYSEAPGIYVVYDYDEGVRFHGRTLARRISIVEGGATVLQIHLDSIEDANSDPNQFVPTRKMLSHGPGAVMVGPFRFPEFVRAPVGYSGTVQPVIVHAILDQKGKVLDAEVVQSSDSVLAEAALGVVWHSSYLPAMRDRPLQREAFINVKFTPVQ